MEAGFPPGVFNVTPGLGETVGRALGLHEGVNMLTFTGSGEVGKRLLQYAGQSNMKLVMAECGGKSPQLVFDDGVDLDLAGEAIARQLLINQGQVCSVGSRLLVQRSIEAALVKKITTHFEKIVIGAALDPKTTFGPLASAKQCARVMDYVALAGVAGAELVAGGHRIREENGGYFVAPTVFRNVSPQSRLAQEEVFGPVLAVMPFGTEAEAIHIANGTSFGLAACVWTSKLSTGLSVAKGIRASVWVNAAAPQGEGPGHAPSFEPFGQSGLGVEGGLAGLESYLQRQLIWINHS
jgi:acyl-CoA reductase-like NAD-dependent aldehyde dehydrogenase